MERVKAILTGVIVLTMVGGARADMTIPSITDEWLPLELPLAPSEYTDWTQYYVDRLEMTIDTPGGFLAPTGFESGIAGSPPDPYSYPPTLGWEQFSNDGTVLVASGPRTGDDLYFTIGFRDAAEYTFHLEAWDGLTLIGSYDLVKEAGEWWNTPTNAVPAPSAAVLTMLGLVAVGLCLRKSERRGQPALS